MHRLIASGFALLALALSVEASAQITFSSGTGTTVQGLGNAQNVCLNESAPSPCPAGATLWGWGGGGWTQNLASIPGATWIWAPGLTGANEGADAQYTFVNTVNVTGTPTAASVYMVADDYVELRVNGTVVGSVGSVVIPTAAPLTQFDVLAHLQAGNNTFSFTAKNGPASFGAGGTTYQSNPAGVVFGGSITLATTVPPPLPPASPVPAVSGWTLLLLALGVAVIGLGRLRSD